VKWESVYYSAIPAVICIGFLIAAFLVSRRHKTIYKGIDELQFESENILRMFLESPSDEAVKIQTDWFVRVIAFLMKHRIEELGGFKSARSKNHPVFRSDFPDDKKNAVLQIMGRQEFLKELKERYNK
jgi:hypothetical protein